jgi:hypothetical protein
MKTAIKVSLAVLLACGALLLVLGIVIWTGNGDALIPVHITLGVVLVLSLWTIAFMAARAGVPQAPWRSPRVGACWSCSWASLRRTC